MSAYNMLVHTLRLSPTIGSIEPQLHLKESASSVECHCIIVTDDLTAFPQGMTCVIRGTKPDGSELFICSASARENGQVMVSILCEDMASTPGTYRCTLTFLNTNVVVRRDTYADYDFATVLPFTVIVHKKAYEE